MTRNCNYMLFTSPKINVQNEKTKNTNQHFHWGAVYRRPITLILFYFHALLQISLIFCCWRITGFSSSSFLNLQKHCNRHNVLANVTRNDKSISPDDVRMFLLLTMTKAFPQTTVRIPCYNDKSISPDDVTCPSYNGKVFSQTTVTMSLLQWQKHFRRRRHMSLLQWQKWNSGFAIAKELHRNSHFQWKWICSK